MDRTIELFNALADRPIAVLTVRRERIVVVRGVLHLSQRHEMFDEYFLMSAAGKVFWAAISEVAFDTETCTITIDTNDLGEPGHMTILFLDRDLSYIRQVLADLTDAVKREAL